GGHDTDSQEKNENPRKPLHWYCLQTDWLPRLILRSFPCPRPRRKYWVAVGIVAAPLTGQLQEVAHDPPRVLWCATALDVELRRIDIAVLDAQTLCLRQPIGPLGRDQHPARRRPFDLAAVALHDPELTRQPCERRVIRCLQHVVRTALEGARRVVAAGPFRRAADVRVNRQFRFLRVAALRAVPRLINAGLLQDGQSPGAAARRPHRQGAFS